MKKKVIIFCLSTLLCLTFAACGNTDSVSVISTTNETAAADQSTPTDQAKSDQSASTDQTTSDQSAPADQAENNQTTTDQSAPADQEQTTSANDSSDNSAASNTPDSDAAVNDTPVSEPQLDFDGTAYTDGGVGEFSVVTPSGSSEGGAVPVVFAGNAAFMQIGVNSTGADGSHLTYIYIDGMYADAKQFSDSQATLNLTSNRLAPGVHRVDFVQYDTDIPEGTVITHKSAAYEVK